jgi:hypothetical protein
MQMSQQFRVQSKHSPSKWNLEVAADEAVLNKVQKNPGQIIGEKNLSIYSFYGHKSPKKNNIFMVLSK